MAGGEDKCVVEAEGVHHAYGDKVVLRGLELRVRAGEIYAILGGNGAGKSTLLSILLGFVTPTAGRTRVGGRDAESDPDGVRSLIAYVPESVALYEHLTARENLDYFLALAKADRDGGAVIDPALEAVGLPREAWSRRVGGFSKGMRQKVAIALALARHVPVLLLDEPTSGLDPKATAEFNQLLRTAKARGVATIMVTHDLLSALDVADRVGFLSGGRLEEMTADSAERFDLRALNQRYGLAGAAA